MMPIGLKLLSNEVFAKICSRLKFSATMASRFVEANEEFIEKAQVRTKAGTTGLKFSIKGQRREEK